MVRAARRSLYSRAAREVAISADDTALFDRLANYLTRYRAGARPGGLHPSLCGGGRHTPFFIPQPPRPPSTRGGATDASPRRRALERDVNVDAITRADVVSSGIRLLDWNGQPGRHIDARSDTNAVARPPRCPYPWDFPNVGAG